MTESRLYRRQLSAAEQKQLRYGQPKNVTITLPERDFRLIVACIWEAQHGDLAFSERSADLYLEQITTAIYAAISRAS